jgi:hypothetical protein
MVWGAAFGNGTTNVAAPTSGTWAAQTVNLIASLIGVGFGVALYGIVAPTSGNNTFSLTFASAVECYLFGSSFSGANQTGGTTTFAHAANNGGASAATSNLAITTAVGNYTVAVGNFGTSGTGDGFTAPASSQVAHDITDPDAVGINFAMAQQATASGTSVTYTLANGGGAVDTLDIVGFDIVAAAAGGGAVIGSGTPRLLMGVGL